MTIDPGAEVDVLVTLGKIKEAIDYLERGLGNCSSPRFKSLIGAGFSNNAKDVALHIDRFVVSCEKTFQVESVYLEMNGFDINPDRWYFDFFAYDGYRKDADDLNWLSDWNSDYWPDLTLTGLEKAQEDFAWYTGQDTKGYEDPEAEKASDFARLLVMCRFAALIEASVKTGAISKKVPILATAHDFDIIARFVD